jgi:hypothetical protein
MTPGTYQQLLGDILHLGIFPSFVIFALVSMNALLTKGKDFGASLCPRLFGQFLFGWFCLEGTHLFDLLFGSLWGHFAVSVGVR